MLAKLLNQKPRAFAAIINGTRRYEKCLHDGDAHAALTRIRPKPSLVWRKVV